VVAAALVAAAPQEDGDVMKNSSILTPKELDELAGIIGEVELQTTGELRLVIVSRSIPTGHMFLTSWMILSSFLWTCLWLKRFWFLMVPDWIMVFAVPLIAILPGWLLSQLPWVQRGLTSVRDLKLHVLHRAEREFHHERLSETAGATGILLFVSLLERQAVVLADRGISSRLNEAIWSEVVAKIIQGAKTKQWRSQLEKAIRQCGEILATHFPAQASNRNELPNHVIVKA